MFIVLSEKLQFKYKIVYFIHNVYIVKVVDNYIIYEVQTPNGVDA